MTNIIDVNGLPYMRVGDITVATATTSASFTGLDIGKDDDYLLVSDVVNGTAWDCLLYFTVNGNSTVTNYYSQMLYASSTTVAGQRDNYPYGITITGAVKGFSYSKIKLTNSGYFVWQSDNSRYYGGSSLGIQKLYGASTFTTTSVTSLTITSSVASAIGIGSRFQLYKLVAEKVADIIVATACTSVDITGLNIDKDGEYMLVSDVVNPTGTSPTGSFYFNNNNTATNYYVQGIYASGTTIASARYNAPYSVENSSNSKTLLTTNIKLTNSGYIVYQSNLTRDYGGSAIQLRKWYGTSAFTTNAITQLSVASSTPDAIGANSRFTLYKIK